MATGCLAMFPAVSEHTLENSKEYFEKWIKIFKIKKKKTNKQDDRSS